jgi:MFS family permease
MPENSSIRSFSTGTPESRNLPERGVERRLPVAVRALRHRNFRLFFAGQLISLIGTWMQSVGESWLVYRLTGSSVLLGFVGFAAQIPVFLMAPAGGIVADRLNRHRIILATQSASMSLAFVLAALTLTGTVRIWHVFVLASLLGLVNAFDIPARQAFVIQMVGREDLINAIALNSAMFNGARIVGPAIAGILVASIGEGWCFFANAASYIAVLISLALMQFPPHQPAPRSGTAVADILAGFRFVTLNRPVYTLLVLLGIVSLVGMPFAVLMPVFADKILHGGARGLGLLMGASGLGAMIGAFTLAARQSLSGLGRWIAYSATGMGLALILFSASRSFWLSAGALVLVGFAMMIEMGASNTLIQSMVPDALRGRVMAVYSMMFMGMSPLGSLFAGIVAGHLGAPMAVGLGGAACTVAGLLFAWRLPSIRGHARDLIQAQRDALLRNES